MSGARTAPLSYGQELFWLLDGATPGLLAYNVPRAFRIRGALDDAALERALQAFVARHAVLRSVYAQQGDHPVQIVVDSATVPFERVDLSGMAADARDAALARELESRAAYHFDLSRDVMLRAALIRLGEAEHVLFLLTHHIVSDGWTKAITFRELSALYAEHAEGQPAQLSPLPLQFADFAERQRTAMSGEALETALRYWREKLRGPLPVLDLPTDPSPSGDPFAGDVRELLLPKNVLDGMRRLGQDNGASLYMVLLAAYQTLLHRYSGQDDVIVGSPTAGRDDEDVQDLVGYFAGALVLRTSFDGDPMFETLLQRVTDTCLDAYEHQDVPFEKLVLELQKGQELTHAPLFQCVLTMEDTIPAALTLGAAEVSPIDVAVSSTKFNLVLLFSEQSEGLRLRLGYRTSLFTAGRIERMLGHLRTLIEAALSAPETPVSALRLLTGAECSQLEAWNATTVDEGHAATLVKLFEAQVARVPDRAAVVAPRAGVVAAGSMAGTVVLTYAELNARANQLAHHLRTMGVQASTPVGLLLDRSADALVALWGILKAGGAYVPLAVDAPAVRTAQQIAESGATIVVTISSAAASLPSGVQIVALDRDAAVLGAREATNPATVASPDDLAYVLYTSGSTGVPKGVAVTHANVVHYVRAVSRVLGDVPADVGGDGLASLDGLKLAMASTLSADLGNTSLFPALLSGATLHVLGKDVTTEPTRFAEYATVHPMDVLKITPSHLAALTSGKTGADLAALLPARWLVTGGEALQTALAHTLLGAGRCRVLNHYGPTETTVGVLTYEVTSSSLDTAVAHRARTVPIGRPLANTTAHVVDARGAEVPVGVPGELFIAGAGVARGYLNRAELTDERFVPLAGTRAYRTGDRVRRLPDGSIEFLGRTDDQVKVRGFRVELAEIEQTLARHPSIAQCAVSLRDADAAEPVLAGYAVPKQGGYAASHAERPTPETLRTWLAEQLPEHMVPAAVMVLDTLPLTANGKVDRAALPAPDAAPAEADRHVEPRTPTEQAVARIWSDVLKKPQVGATDSFLDLGGHSLLAIRVLGRISKEFGVRLALRALFEHPTVADVAALVDAERRQREDEEAVRLALAAAEGLSDGEVERMLTDAARDGG